jgi:uncharacterized protein YukE
MSNQDRFNDKGINDKRRKDPELRRLFDAIEKVGKDCNDQHIETQKVLDDMNNTQSIFGERIQGITKTLDRIGEKVDKNAENVAATDATVVSLSAQNKSPLINNEGNIKWLVVGVVSVLLVVLLAYGVITVDDVKTLKG